MGTARFRMTGQRTRVLRALARGAVEDRAGRAVQKLAATTHHESQESLALALVRLERLGLVRRDVRGKRTYRVEITPEGRQALLLPAPPTAPRPSVPPKRGRVLFDSLPAGPARCWPAPAAGDGKAEDRQAEDRQAVAMPAAPTSAEPSPAPAVAVEFGVPIDYEVLAGVLLKKALTAIEAESTNAATVEELRRTNAAQELARRRVAELERELAEAKRRLFELDANLRVAEANNAALIARFERASERGTLRATISDRQVESLETLRRDLERLMIKPPARRG